MYALYILGTQRDSPSHVPLFAIPELRRPRAVEYRLWLGNRLSTVRMWLVVYCLALLLPHASLASAGQVLEACAGGSPPTEWAHPFAVVVLAGLACTTHLQCSARWFWGMPLDEAEAAWRWPKRQAGEHPHQLLPPAPLALHTAAPPVMPLQPLAAGGDRTPPPSAKHALPHGAQRRAHTASKTAPGKALPDASGSLRIVCCTIGTRGDVEPFVALGRALVDRGHEFAICSTDNFAEFVTEAGLEFIPLGLPRIEQPAAWLEVGSVGEMMEVTFKAFHIAYHKVAMGFFRAAAGSSPPVFAPAPGSRDGTLSMPRWLTALGQANPALRLGDVVEHPETGLGEVQYEGGMGGGLDAASSAAIGDAAATELAVRVQDKLYGVKTLHPGAGEAGGSAGVPVDARGPLPPRRRADVILGTAHTISFALNVSEALGIPTWIAKLGPDNPSSAYGPPGVSSSPVGFLNKLAHYAYWVRVAVATKVVPIQAMEEAFRRVVLGLGDGSFAAADRLHDMGFTPQFLPISPVLFPKPLDTPAWVFQTGFWMNFSAHGYNHSSSDSDTAGSPAAAPAWRPPAWLVDFFHRSRGAVLCITFGSMVLATSNGTVSKLVRAALAQGYRVLLMHGWAEPPEDLADVLPEPIGRRYYSEEELLKEPHAGATRTVAVIRAAPHDWVFEQVAAVAHHGGAGTTAKVLAAGLPSLVIPVLRWADQMQWGDMVHNSGLGLKVREKEPSQTTLERAVARLMQDKDGIRRNADLAGARLRAERSAHVAGTLLESCLCNLLLPPAKAAALYQRPLPVSLSPVQRMCLRHCVPCNKLGWRTEGTLEPSAASRLGVRVGHCTPPDVDTAASIPPPYALLAQALEEGAGGSTALDAAQLTHDDVDALNVFSVPAVMPHLTRCARIQAYGASAVADSDASSPATPPIATARRRVVVPVSNTPKVPAQARARSGGRQRKTHQT